MARDKSLMGQAEQSIQHICGLRNETGKKSPVESKPYNETLLLENPGTYCRKWPARKVSEEVPMLVEDKRKPHDTVMCTDGSVTRDGSGLGIYGQSRVEGLYTKTVKPT